MKKSLVVLMVVALLAVSAVPAFAARGGPAQPPAPVRGGQFTLVGTITAIAGDVVTVKVVSGNPIARPVVGQDVALQTTAATRFLRTTATGTVVITLADLQVGDNVSAQGQLAEGLWTAGRITVGAKIIHP
jgi:hypothetical protein